jgi:hypothetical protein
MPTSESMDKLKFASLLNAILLIIARILHMQGRHEFSANTAKTGFYRGLFVNDPGQLHR